MSSLRQRMDIIGGSHSVSHLAASLYVEAPVSLRKLIETPLFQQWALEPRHKKGVTFRNGVVHANWDGTWACTGHLHDSSALAGDTWTFGFVFAGTPYVFVTSGKLGAEASGPARNHEIQMSGKEIGIAKNRERIFNGQVLSQFHAFDDPGQLVDAIGKDLKDIYNELFGGGGDDPEHPEEPEHPEPEPDDDQ